MKNGYIKIYTTLNTAEAHLIGFLFENNGIESIIDNEDMTPLFGMISAKDAGARVWVRAEQYQKASALLSESSSIDLSNKKMVRCKRCGEMVCDIFEYCWSCMADMKSGEPDPDRTEPINGDAGRS